MNTQIITVNNPDGTTIDWVQIETAPEQFTSMLKTTYDAQQAASTLPSESSIPTTPQAGV